MVRRTESTSFESATQFFSKNSLTAFSFLPPIAFALKFIIQCKNEFNWLWRQVGDDLFSINRFPVKWWARFTFHAEYVPAGSFKYSCGLPSFANPASMLLTPKGRTPPLCVYFCWVFAMNLAMYSIDGASSQVSRKLWVSMRACGKMCETISAMSTRFFFLAHGVPKYAEWQVSRHAAKVVWHYFLTFSINTLASAVKPANAKVKCSSNFAIFRMVLDSWRVAVAFLSTPKMMQSAPLTPTTAEPLLTASMAYSTWKRWPSGEKTVIALS